MKKQLTIAVALILGCISANAQNPVLVKDINTKHLSSEAGNLHYHKGKVYFAASHNDRNGSELMVVDTNGKNLKMVKDIYPGIQSSRPTEFCSFGDILLFSATSPVGGTELWRTDGTDTGTYMVVDIAGGISSSPQSLMKVGNKVIYVGTHDTAGRELFITDGTKAGTKMLKDINPGKSSSSPYNLTVLGDSIFFRAQTAKEGNELWMSDGTAAGTKLVKDIRTGTSSGNPQFIAAYKGKIYFNANDGTTGAEMWVSDGSDTGTHVFSDVISGTGGAYPTGMTQCAGYLYFAANDGTKGVELYRINGKDTMIHLVKDLDPWGNSRPHNFVAVDSTLFFIAEVDNGKELYVSDGTANGTKLTRDLYPIQTDGFVSNMTAVGGTLFFTAHQSGAYYDWELFSVTPPSTYPRRVKNINPDDASSPSSLIPVGDILFFTADDGSTGREIWTSKGSKTELFVDVWRGTQDAGILSVESYPGGVLFNARGEKGDELYRTDGSDAGTQIVKDLYSGSSSGMPRNLFRHGNRVYFTGRNSIANRLWYTDGTESGTKDVRLPAGNDVISEFTLMNNELYFVRDGYSTSEMLYKYVSGSYTYKVKPVNGNGVGDRTKYLTAFKNNIYFSAYSPYVGQNYGTELFKSNGSTSTAVLKDINPGRPSSSPFGMTVADSFMCFVATDDKVGRELWITDGTESGTKLLKDINTSGNSSISNLAATSKGLFFGADNGTDGIELWITDGTTAGTKLLKNIAADSGDSDPRQMFAMDSILYFVANDSINGDELWRTDGTASGTWMLKDITAGAGSTTIGEYIRVRDELYFTADDGKNGMEIWKTDGTTKGTEMLPEVWVGEQGSNPAELTLAVDTLFFVANHPDYGRELFWLFTNCMVADFVAGKGCVGKEIDFQDRSNALGDSITSYLWEFGNGDTSHSANPKYAYAKSGQFDVTLTVVNSKGCTVVKSKEIMVDSLPHADFTVANDSLCLNGNEFVFTNKSEPAGGLTYVWDWNDGTAQSVDLNPKHKYKYASTYKVTLIAKRGLECADTADMLVTTLPHPTTPSIKGPTTSVHKVDTFWVQGTTGHTYTWGVTGGNQISGGTSDTMTLEWDKATKQGIIYCRATNEHGCQGAQERLNVKVQVVGIEDLLEAGIALYPNPTTGAVRLDLGDWWKEDGEVQIIDQTGRTILALNHNDQNANGVFEFDLSGHAKGIYFVKLTRESGSLTGRIILK